MNNFFNNLKQKLQTFMYGRYGMDDLSRFMIYLSLATILLSMFSDLRFLSLLTTILLVVSYFRMLSRQCSKRYDENQKFLVIKRRVMGFIKFKKKSFDDRGLYKYYSCSVCHQRLRVPVGKGKIKINCPKCKNSFIKKT